MINLKEETIGIEDRLRKELSIQISNEVTAIKDREEIKRLKTEENLKIYHETRMDIVQNSVRRDRRLRMRRSCSLDSRDITVTWYVKYDLLYRYHIICYNQHVNIVDTVFATTVYHR